MENSHSLCRNGELTVGSIGEDELVARLLGGLKFSEGILTGPGDDCAVVEAGNQLWLLKVDALHEDVHFLRSHAASCVGWKAMARPLSDIAAMAGVPKFALVAIAVPGDLPLKYIEGIYRGLRRACAAFQVAIVGGETSRSPGGIFLTVSLIGTAPQGLAIMRSGARDGDHIWVTGCLGGSFPTGKHLRFRPRLAEAAWLAQNANPSAMMDLSDGLGTDLPRLAKQSGLGFVLDESAIPCTPGFGLHNALGDGEDYELLFTVAPQISAGLFERWRAVFPRVPLTRIGEMRKGAPNHCSLRGYTHF